MKNLIFIITLTIIVISCNNSKPTKELASKAFDSKSEIDKDYQFIYTLESDSVCVDGYGKPIVSGKWYLHSTKASTYIPVVLDPEHGYGYNDFNYADKTEHFSKMRIKGDVKSVEYTIPCKIKFGSGAKLVKVKMLLFGPRYVEVSSDGLRYSLDESK